MIARPLMRPQGDRTLRRRSQRYPGLELLLDFPFLTFKQNKAFEVFKLEGGHPQLVACSRKGYTRLEVFEHTRDVAIAYAAAMATGRQRPGAAHFVAR